MKTIEMIFLKKPYSIKKSQFYLQFRTTKRLKTKIEYLKNKNCSLVKTKISDFTHPPPYFANSSRLKSNNNKSQTLPSKSNIFFIQVPTSYNSYYFPNENTIKDILKRKTAKILA